VTAKGPSAAPCVRWRRWLLGTGLVAVIGIGCTVAIHDTVLRAGNGRIYFDADLVPAREVAIVLGTSPKTRNRSNPFFESRMDAAAGLWKRGKVRHFILSGDNGRKGYDEPTAMREALIGRGVSAEAITLDYAGFRTLDTMARAHTVFGQRKVMVITDDFHLPRSLFLADAHGMDAVGFGGRPVPLRWSKKTRTREVASRLVAWLDVHLLRTKPKFFGPPIVVPNTTAAF
jgi:SanA protein